MDDVPEEILKQNVAEYLPPSGVRQLSITSKKLHAQLSLSTTPPRRILTEFSRTEYRNGNADHGPYSIDYGFEIPVPSQVECHSIFVSMSWRDQGWGNQKSYLVVLAGDKETRLGPVVFASDIAPHSQQRLEITFNPERDQSYHLWYVVGGGGGHSLHLSDVTIEALVFDDPSHSFFKACNFFARRNSLLPWDKAKLLLTSSQQEFYCNDSLETILASTCHLLEQGQSVLPPMISFFRHSGVSEADLSLKLMELIGSILEGFAHELNLYDIGDYDIGGDSERVGFQQWDLDEDVISDGPMRLGNQQWDHEEPDVIYDPPMRRRHNLLRRGISWGRSAMRSRRHRVT